MMKIAPPILLPVQMRRKELLMPHKFNVGQLVERVDLKR